MQLWWIYTIMLYMPALFSEKKMLNIKNFSKMCNYTLEESKKKGVYECITTRLSGRSYNTC